MSSTDQSVMACDFSAKWSGGIGGVTQTWRACLCTSAVAQTWNLGNGGQFSQLISRYSSPNLYITNIHIYYKLPLSVQYVFNMHWMWYLDIILCVLNVVPSMTQWPQPTLFRCAIHRMQHEMWVYSRMQFAYKHPTWRGVWKIVGLPCIISHLKMQCHKGSLHMVWL